MRRVVGLLALSLLATSGLRAETHLFTSADGKKKLEATLLAYDAAAGTVQIRIYRGQTMTAPLSAFSKEDAEYVVEANQRLEVGRRMGVNVSGNNSDPVETNTATANTKKQSFGFGLNFRNNGTEPMEGVKAMYRIFYTEDLAKAQGGRAEKFKDGELELSALAPRESVDIKTESVELTTVRVKPARAST